MKYYDWKKGAASLERRVRDTAAAPIDTKRLIWEAKLTRVDSLCTSCATIKVFYLVPKLFSGKPVAVTVKFNDGENAPIVLPVPSRSRDYVSYEVSRTSTDLLDHGLTEINIGQETCKRSLTRDYVMQFVKDNNWTLRIDDTVLRCDE